MNAFQYQMLACIDELRLAPGITAPKDKHQVLLSLAERLDGSIGKLLPAFALMTRRVALSNNTPCLAQRVKSPVAGIGVPRSI